MNTLSNLLTAIIIAAWFGAIAVFSIQNIQSASLKFIFFQSIELPLGVMLAFSVGIGVIVGAILPVFGKSSPSRQRQRGRNFDKRDLLEDDVLEDWDEKSPANW